MKKKILKISVLIMSIIMALNVGVFGCSSNADGETHPTLPDYPNGKEFDFFAYRAITNGKYYIDEEEFFTGEDFRSLERYKEYKEAGFSMVMILEEYYGEKWDTSIVKTCMDYANEAGIEKILLKDNRINGLCDTGIDNILAQFPTDADLDAYISNCLKNYCNYKGFYGLVLKDEMNYKKQEGTGKIYKSLKRVAKDEYGVDIYLHLNLAPHTASNANLFDSQTEDYALAYKNYVEGFVREADAERISADTYIFHGYGVEHGFYGAVQIIRDICTKYNAELTYCLQSFHTKSGNVDAFRKVGKSEMYMELNSLIGFGANNFAYYTYNPDPWYSSSGGKTLDDSSFLTRDGERTNVYYYGQQLMSEIQPLAKIITNYDYCGSKIYTNQNSPIKFSTSPYLQSRNRGDYSKVTAIVYDNSHEFNLLKSYAIDNDVSFVSELKDQENDLYMYMFQNVIDPVHASEEGVNNGDTDMNITATFDSSYTWAFEYNCGNVRYVKLDNGVYTNTLSAGYAVYVVPLK